MDHSELFSVDAADDVCHTWVSAITFEGKEEENDWLSALSNASFSACTHFSKFNATHPKRSIHELFRPRSFIRVQEVSGVDHGCFTQLDAILPRLENVAVSFPRESDQREEILKPFTMNFPGFMCSSGHSNVQGLLRFREIRLILDESQLASCFPEDLSSDDVLFVTKDEISLEKVPSGCNILIAVDPDTFNLIEESGPLVPLPQDKEEKKEEKEEKEKKEKKEKREKKEKTEEKNEPEKREKEETASQGIKRIAVEADLFNCGALCGIVFQSNDETKDQKLSIVVGNGREEIRKKMMSLLPLIVNECYAHLSSILWLKTIFGGESHINMCLSYVSLLLGCNDQDEGSGPILDLKTLRSLCELKVLKTQQVCNNENETTDADADADTDADADADDASSSPFEVWWLLYHGDGDVSVHDFIQSIASEKPGIRRFYSKETCMTVSMKESTSCDDSHQQSASLDEYSSFLDQKHLFFIATSSPECALRPLSDSLLGSSFGRLLRTLFSCAKDHTVHIEIKHAGWNDKALVMECSTFCPYSISCPWNLAPDRALDLGRASYDRYLSHLQGIGDQLIEETFSVLQQLMMESSRLGAEFAETLGTLAQTLVDQEKHFKESVHKLLDTEVFQGFDALDSFGREIVRFVLTWNKIVRAFMENYGHVEEGTLITSTMSDDAPEFDENPTSPIVDTFDKISLSTWKKKPASNPKKKSPFLEESTICVVKPTVGKDKLNLKLIAIPSSFLPDHSTRKMYTDLPTLHDKERIVPIVFDDEFGSFVSYFLLSSEYLNGLTVITGDEDVSLILMGEKRDDAVSDAVAIKTFSDFLTSSDFRHIRASFFDSIIRESVEICAYFPHQFAALRRFVVGKENLFLQSLCRSSLSSQRPRDDVLSQSLTWNEMFLIREVSQEEATNFCEVAGTYFAYMSKIISQNYESIMSKIVGLFHVNTVSRENPIYFFVMENNLCTHADDEHGEVFVLHGDQFGDDGVGGSYTDVEVCGVAANVQRDKDVLGRVMMGKPFIVDGRSWEFLKMAVWNDSLFLSSMQIMDYAVVLLVMEEHHKYIVSIADHTSRFKASRHFDYWTKSEDSRKRRIRRINHPSEYKEVFRKAMQKYFATVPSPLYPQ
eukprot:TRINITY_DN230_c1_g5_i1.p1 TRINITY_DN230_c1_g5~~TRINITY_DN230_c1_g5_i1.p1  ORF type:complete len:1146 (+),score=316.92 TRINITY_DN230_c1_g5_i1:86-3439(+)